MKKMSNYFLGLHTYFYALLVAFIVLSILSCKRKTIINSNQTYYVLNLVLPSSDSGAVVAYRDSEYTMLVSESGLKLGDKLYLKATPAIGCIVVKWRGVDEGSESVDKTTAIVTINSTNEKVCVSFGIDVNLTINKNATTIELGLTDTLMATFTPNNVPNLLVSWSSLNPAIATIDNHGIITAKAEGIVKMIATPSINGIAPDTCIINVNLWNGTTLTPVSPANNIYLINAASQLAWIANTNNGGVSFADKKVMLNHDINLNHKLWTPIGKNYQTYGFVGLFDGNNKTISNLYVNYAGSGGLFSYIGDSTRTILGTVQNVVLNNVNITAARNSGALVARVLYGVIKNCTITSGVVITTSDNHNAVGGLVGEMDKGSIENSNSAANVKVQVGATQGDAAGGLVGINNFGEITASFSTGNVEGDGFYVGGLVGTNYGNITACKASGFVNGAYGGRGGGLVGKNDYYNTTIPVISSSYATGNVGGNIKYGGGLVGRNYDNNIITDCYATGTVSSTSPTTTFLGSIAGDNRGTISFSTSTISDMQTIGINTGDTNQVVNNSTNVFDNMTNPANTATAFYNGNTIPVIDLWKNEYWNVTNSCPKLIWE